MKNNWTIKKALCYMWTLVLLGIIQNTNFVPNGVKTIVRVLIIVISLLAYWRMRKVIKEELG